MKFFGFAMLVYIFIIATYASEECTVCFDAMPFMIRNLKCKHELCTWCFHKIWIDKKPCPLCRGLFPKYEHEYEIIQRYGAEDKEIDNIPKQKLQNALPVLCATAKHVSIVNNWIIKFQLDVNVPGFLKDKPIDKCKSVEIAEFLYVISKGAKHINTALHGRSALHYAAQEGNFELAKYFIESCGIPINQQDERGGTAIWNAAHIGHLDFIIRMVEELGANIYIKNKSATSPLWVASQNGFTEVVSYLLDKGAEIEETNDDGTTTPLFITIQMNQYETAKFLLENNANVNATKDCGGSPLWYSCQLQQFEFVKILYEHGADINAKNDEGVPPIGAAVYFNKDGKFEIAKFLLKQGAKVDVAIKWMQQRSNFDYRKHIKILQKLKREVKVEPDDVEVTSDPMIALMRGTTQDSVDGGAEEEKDNQDALNEAFIEEDDAKFFSDNAIYLENFMEDKELNDNDFKKRYNVRKYLNQLAAKKDANKLNDESDRKRKYY